MIKINDLTVSYGNNEVLKSFDVSFKKGEMVAILGPNGCGKTTFVSAVSGIIPSYKGSIEICGRDATSYSNKERAKTLAVLPQKTEPVFGLTVKSIVMMGRYAHSNSMFGYSSKDYQICDQAMQKAGIDHLQERVANSLSGGEFQKVLMARTLCQQAEIMLLDEVSAGVDVAGNISLFSLLKKLNKEGQTIICVLHDLNLAALFFDRLIFFKNGKVQLDGSPKEVMTSTNISNIYDASVSIVTHPKANVPQVLFSIADY